MVKGGASPDTPKPVEYSGCQRLKVKLLFQTWVDPIRIYFHAADGCRRSSSADFQDYKMASSISCSRLEGNLSIQIHIRRRGWPRGRRDISHLWSSPTMPQGLAQTASISLNLPLQFPLHCDSVGQEHRVGDMALPV